MLVTRRVEVYDGDELVGVDYVSDGVLRANSRVIPHDDSTPGKRRRRLQLKAMEDLKSIGWKNREIAEILGFTLRHIEQRRSDYRRALELRAKLREDGRV
jgi:hypothetical protein